MADCTPEQKKLVDEILSVEATDYYKVLKVQKSSDDVEIKKSYRKLAIKLHPDKNKHPKASEAFKVIAKAFEVLSDGSKRKLYDMTGRDPDSRGGGGGASTAGFRGNGFPAGQQGFPADDIFNMFFGGGPGGFGNGGFQTFQFGANGFPGNGFYFNPGMNGGQFRRQHQQHAGTNARRRATGEQEPPTPRWVSYLSQYLPIILILLSVVASMFSSDKSTDSQQKKFKGRVPRYGFEQRPPLVIERTTPMYNVPYYISEQTKNDFENRKNSEVEFRGLDRYVENKYVEGLETGCYIEKRKQEAMLNDGYGLFYNDWEMIERAKNLEMPNCAKLQALKLI